METQLLNEIIDCLPKDRTVFRYARDEYALMLLSNYVDEGKPVAAIKQSKYRGLLNKSPVKILLGSCGKGQVTRSDFRYVYVNDRQDFVLSVGKWNQECVRFSQTTRNSANLVLQLNFNTEHDATFQRLIGAGEVDFFQFDGHPILKKGERRYFRNTLGWARFDLDFNTGEVLIEEIQNDWLRRARRYLSMMTRYIADHPDYQKKLAIKATPDSIEHYVKQTLYPFYKIWDEAILTAAIQFSVEELGIKRIYYHTFDTGNKLKNITWGHPPRSLYTDLPKKFCFEITDEVPKFLAKSKVVKRKLKKVKNPHWHELVM